MYHFSLSSPLFLIFRITKLSAVTNLSSESKWLQAVILKAAALLILSICRWVCEGKGRESIGTSDFSLHSPLGNRSGTLQLTLMDDKAGSALLENPPGMKCGLQPMGVAMQQFCTRPLCRLGNCCSTEWLCIFALKCNVPKSREQNQAQSKVINKSCTQSVSKDWVTVTQYQAMTLPWFLLLGSVNTYLAVSEMRWDPTYFCFLCDFQEEHKERLLHGPLNWG